MLIKFKIKGEMKTCSKCGIEQPLTEFHKNKLGRDGRQPRCRTCLHQYQRKYRQSNGYGAQLKYKYGITLAQYKELLEKQNNRCLICNTEFDLKPGRLYKPVVDHCHSQNKVRGILCHPCNVALGLLKEDPVVITKALEYIKCHL